MSDDVNLALGAVSGAIVGAIGTVMAVRRRWSKDTAENAQDTAQVNLLESLQAERDDARTQAEKLLAKHIADTKTIAELTADKQRSARDVRRLRRLVPAEDAQKFLGSDPGALDGLDFGYGRRRGDSAEMLAEAIARLPPPERQLQCAAPGAAVNPMLSSGCTRWRSPGGRRRRHAAARCAVPPGTRRRRAVGGVARRARNPWVARGPV